MLLKVRAEFKTDLHHSIMVGDSRSDVEAAQAAGIERVYWLDDKGSALALPDGYLFVYLLKPVIERLNF
jgi:histidinol phosphatase-like enzyme